MTTQPFEDTFDRITFEGPIICPSMFEPSWSKTLYLFWTKYNTHHATVNPSWRSPKNKSCPHGSVTFHGGVLRITQKGLYVRTTIAMVSFHHLPIDAPPWKAA